MVDQSVPRNIPDIIKPTPAAWTVDPWHDGPISISDPTILMSQ